MWYKFTFKIFLIFACTTTQIGSHSSKCWEIVISWIKNIPALRKSREEIPFLFKLVVTNTKILLKHDGKQPKDFMNESFAVLVSRTGNVEKHSESTNHDPKSPTACEKSMRENSRRRTVQVLDERNLFSWMNFFDLFH